MGFFARRHARESALSEGAVEALSDGELTRRSPLFDSLAPSASEPVVEAPPAAADLGAVGKLIRSALEQGNVTVLAGDEVLDLEPAGLRGHAFEPVHLPETKDN
jgi:hypothetical protein